MKIDFYDRLKIVALVFLQGFIFYFWQTSVIGNNITVFNLLGLTNSWFLPLAIFIFVLLNSALALFVFQKNYFLKTFLFLFNFFLLILELIIVGYYLITI
jgi:hypothetical protein